ncbi:methyltransferase domain-containing protein [Arsenicicoccus dermatophilus]|uniref:methyltransferase domain-containing protein n=1 Tax=Arsenicicoccus dermatophilus TaxID=1076331 RepID=UPI003916FA19
MTAVAAPTPVVQSALPLLPFPDGTFDAVAADFVVDHLSDPRAGVQELARLTRPGGTLVATIWPAGGLDWQRLVSACFAAAGATASAPRLRAHLSRTRGPVRADGPERMPRRGPHLAMGRPPRRCGRGSPAGWLVPDRPIWRRAPVTGSLRGGVPHPERRRRGRRRAPAGCSCGLGRRDPLRCGDSRAVRPTAGAGPGRTPAARRHRLPPNPSSLS